MVLRLMKNDFHCKCSAVCAVFCKQNVTDLFQLKRDFLIKQLLSEIKFIDKT